MKLQYKPANEAFYKPYKVKDLDDGIWIEKDSGDLLLIKDGLGFWFGKYDDVDHIRKELHALGWSKRYSSSEVVCRRYE